MADLHEDNVLPVTLRALNDTVFIEQMEANTGVEHSTIIRTLHFINELERRKLFLELGYSSVFDCCVRRLGYSESAAGRRIQAARCARRYPELFPLLREHEVSISTLAMIEPILRDENKDSIIEGIRGASRREVEKVISEYRPPVALRDRVRYVQVPVPEPRNIDVALLDRECARAVPEIWRDRRMTEQKVHVQFVADEEFLQLFEEIRDLMSNQHDLSFADIMKAALVEYRDRHSPAARHARREAKKGPAGDDSHWRELNSNELQGSRHIPDDIRDEVFVRDGRQCTFEAADGTRCQSKKGLEIDHIVPYSAGGTHDPSNLRLLCGAHNRLMAERALGKHVMQPFWRRQ